MNDNFITFEFRIKYRLKEGQEMYVLGDHIDFGNWNKKFKLDWSNGDIWKKEYKMNINKSKCIFFKFAFTELNSDKLFWENGPNRILDKKNIYNLKIEDKKYILDCIWSGFNIIFNMHHHIEIPDSTMVILGNDCYLGNWETKNCEKYQMKLEENKEFKKEKVWKKNIQIFFNESDGEKEEIDLNYKYLIYNYKNKNFLYEGGMDRHIRILFKIDENNDELKFYSLTNTKEYKLLTNSLLVIDDNNFINEEKK